MVQQPEQSHRSRTEGSSGFSVIYKGPPGTSGLLGAWTREDVPLPSTSLQVTVDRSTVQPGLVGKAGPNDRHTRPHPCSNLEVTADTRGRPDCRGEEAGSNGWPTMTAVLKSTVFRLIRK